ncbi:coiled-coil domain-containing protein [Dryocola clanedunensis]|uniref:chemotaxis protein n=1 Tax=Cedecea sulfonylureivorans TaxID=3051154 RepID=UPI001925798C|nr:chemotaxis protein [Cedecea sulfonylureivorans]
MTNKVILETVNTVSWSVDNNSYARARKKILSLKAAHEKPAEKLAKSQQRIANSEGRAALAAAKAQTQRLKQAQQLGKEQQKQAQIQAKQAAAEQSHARKMANLAAKSQSDQARSAEALARQNMRLARISEKVRAASQHRAMAYNPDAPSIGREHYNPAVAARQNAQMARGAAAVAAEITAQKRSLAIEEKKEAALKREVTYYNSLRKSALTLANVNGADVATRYKAISAAKQVLELQKRENYTVEETRFEMARITSELRKQARLQQRITREQKAAGARAGRIRTEGRGGRPGLAAAGVIGGATLVGSLGIARAGQTLQGSLERNQQMKTLQSQGVSRLEYEAVRDVVANKTGFNISPDKALDFQADYRDKVGQLTANGVWKTDKNGKATLSGAGELGDLINAIAGKSNAATAKRVVKELGRLDFNTFLVYLKDLQKTFRFSDQETAAFAESINDASKVLPAFADGGEAVQKRMNDLARNGYALSDAQQEQLNRLGALSIEYSRINNSLSDTFSAGFVSGLSEYAANTDNLSKGFSGLIPITDGLGKSLGEMSAAVLKLTSWFSSIDPTPENKHERLASNGVYYEDSAVGRLWASIKKTAETFTGASVIPGVTQTPQAALGPGTAWNTKPLSFGAPSLSYRPQQPTFNPSGLNVMARRQPSINIAGQASISQQMDVFVHDGAVKNLIDTALRDNNQAQNNMLLGIVP